MTIALALRSSWGHKQICCPIPPAAQGSEHERLTAFRRIQDELRECLLLFVYREASQTPSARRSEFRRQQPTLLELVSRLVPRTDDMAVPLPAPSPCALVDVPVLLPPSRGRSRFQTPLLLAGTAGQHPCALTARRGSASGSSGVCGTPKKQNDKRSFLVPPQKVTLGLVSRPHRSKPTKPSSPA